MNLQFEPLTPARIPAYVQVGIQAYTEHYLYLWENRDPSSFLNAHLTNEAVAKNLQDPQQHFYIVKVGETPIGILLLVLDAEPVPGIAAQNVYLSKIYLRNAYTGQGLGKQTLDFVQARAKEWGKETVWLCAMKKGPSLKFYKENGYAIVGETEIRLPKVLDTEKEMWWMARPLEFTNPRV